MSDDTRDIALCIAGIVCALLGFYAAQANQPSLAVANLVVGVAIGNYFVFRKG